MERNKGKIITVTSTKGGVGKTITTLNLAGVFSNLKKKVLVIDFDLYGGAVATYLNSKNDKTIFNLITDLSNNKYKNIDDYIYNHNEYISILSAPKDPRFANKMDSKYIPIILNNVVYKYDVILIDTTHILNEINNETRTNILDLNLSKEELLAKDKYGVSFIEYLLAKKIPLFCVKDKIKNRKKATH